MKLSIPAAQKASNAHVVIWLNVLLADATVYFLMSLGLDLVGLLTMWDFLGAIHITYDIHVAMQTHGVERQFNNWLFHVLLHEELQSFAHVHFYSRPAHPRLTARLQRAVDFLVLRCVNQDLRNRCTIALQTRGVVLHEFVCASRRVHSLDPIITNAPRCVMGSAMDDIGMVFERVRVALEKQHEFARGSEEQTGNRTDSVRSLENNLGELYSKNAALGAKIFEHELSHWYAEWNHRY